MQKQSTDLRMHMTATMTMTWTPQAFRSIILQVTSKGHVAHEYAVYIWM